MPSTGTYEEQLPCGGKLKVSQASWQIDYYFPGPDARHNGTFVTVPGASVSQYVVAFQENWHEYEVLKSTIPKGGDFNKAGKMSMSIRIGGYNEGVCIRSYHMPINTRTKLETVIEGYRYAAKRATQIQQFLAAL